MRDGADVTGDEARRHVEAFLAARDEASFLAIYRAHTPFILLMARRLLGEATDAEDAIQEAWVRAVRALPGFRWESGLRTWLASIAINCAREMIRRRRPDESDAASAIEGEVPRPAPSREVEPLVRRLPDGYREVLVLHDVEGYTHEAWPGSSSSEHGAWRRPGPSRSPARTCATGA